MDLNDMLVFTKVVQAGSFTSAARMLGMPKSTVSRRLKALEARIGAQLIQRTTRKLGLTDAGRVYYEHGARIVAEAEEAELAVSQMRGVPCGTLRITAPLAFGKLGEVVAEYLCRYPAVEVDLSCTDRTVDLVSDGFDLAIRLGRLGDSSLVARRIGTLEESLVASPAYLRKRGVPKTPANLGKHDAVMFVARPGPPRFHLTRKDETVDAPVRARLAVNDMDVMRVATAAGVGIASMPSFVAAEALRSGQLKAVLPGWSSRQVPIHAVYPSTRHLSPKVTAFVELVATALGDGPR